MRLIAAVALAISMFLSACTTSLVRQKPAEKQRPPIELIHQAWEAARVRLHRMCPGVPRTEAELTHALSTEHENGCYARLAKDTFTPNLDWHWHWLPPYRVVAAVHDEELRKRVIPRFYEEYISGLNRYLAEKVDRGEITPGQFRYVINASWSWLNGKMQSERVLLEENMRSPDNTDAKTRSTLSHVAGELATLATLGLAISAPDKMYQPAPANCYAYPAKAQNFTIQCY
jgi:hypothetical protein